MDTSILHNRISEYKEKATHPKSKEMILLFETWFLSIENYLSEIEMDLFESQIKVNELRNTISSLCDIIIITGHADKVELINTKDPNISKAITLLLRDKDRKNHNEISTISTLLSIHSDIEFQNLKQLKDHVCGE